MRIALIQMSMEERGATQSEVEVTVGQGEKFPAKFGRTGFRRNFAFDRKWRGAALKH
jgi:hypothetical protein